jgi:hypothetical protein
VIFLADTGALWLWGASADRLAGAEPSPPAPPRLFSPGRDPALCHHSYNAVSTGCCRDTILVSAHDDSGNLGLQPAMQVVEMIDISTGRVTDHRTWPARDPCGGRAVPLCANTFAVCDEKRSGFYVFDKRQGGGSGGGGGGGATHVRTGHQLMQRLAAAPMCVCSSHAVLTSHKHSAVIECWDLRASSGGGYFCDSPGNSVLSQAAASRPAAQFQMSGIGPEFALSCCSGATPFGTSASRLFAVSGGAPGSSMGASLSSWSFAPGPTLVKDDPGAFLLPCGGRSDAWRLSVGVLDAQALPSDQLGRGVRPRGVATSERDVVILTAGGSGKGVSDVFHRFTLR